MLVKWMGALGKTAEGQIQEAQLRTLTSSQDMKWASILQFDCYNEYSRHVL